MMMQPFHLLVVMATGIALVQCHGGEHHISADGCGVTKGCFRDPSGCTGPTDCDYFTSWMLDENKNNKFTVTGTATGYVALGFSNNPGMKDSDVYACTKNNEVVRSYNNADEYQNIGAELKGVSEVAVAVVDGRIECSFIRQAYLVDNDATYFDLRENNTYNIIMAKSDDLTGDGNVVYHGATKTGSPEQFSFTDFEDAVGGMEGLPLQKSHGSLMVIAWVGFASVGIVMARFFKPMWPDTKICGVAVWFALHRTFMVMTFLCTVAAFIIIFIHTGYYFTPDEGLPRFLHALFGTIVTFCVILNPVMALFRPHPGEPRRPIFNWAHWFVGTGGHTLAMVTIIIGLNNGDFVSLIDDLPSRVFWVMIAFIFFHYIVWLLFEIQRCLTDSQGRTNDIPLHGSDKGSSQQHLSQNDSYAPPPECFRSSCCNKDDAYRDDRICQTTEEGSMAKTVLLVIYLVGVLFTVIFIVTSIAVVPA
ncbi:putative ferric-chelate reductase 1 isoform X2 [Amphiura filiformis]|uniref:putative ferric-chelate reductase 1 isoform X2 n=1 Tax=Amphiura filiformis TaxID=82378 RepID=UPI003B213F35